MFKKMFTRIQKFITKLSESFNNYVESEVRREINSNHSESRFYRVFDGILIKLNKVFNIKTFLWFMTIAGQMMLNIKYTLSYKFNGLLWIMRDITFYLWEV